MELEHFSHDHPLILNERNKGDGVEVSCYGCVQPISGPSYGCTLCQFFLHKSCAELPREITHPSHPEHPLTLLPNPPSYYGGCICDICRQSFYRFIYHCSHCEFDVDINCASMVNNIHHRVENTSHGHQLIPLQKPAKFFCDACGTKHKGSSFLCTTCGFWANQKCALLPKTMLLRKHRHPLTLIYSIPYEYYRFSPKCKICVEEVYRRSWVYYCSECSYFVHVNCVPSEPKHSKDSKIETELPDLDHNLMEPNSSTSGTTTRNTALSKAEIKAEDLNPNPITLPVPNASVDLTTQFIRAFRVEGKYKAATEISHVSHDHPLIFSDKQIDDESCSGSKLPLLDEMENDDENCNGCIQTISAPFYRCAQCKFTLHQWCAELPNELRHPCHPEHPLRLITQQSTNLHLYQCPCCSLFSNAFIFGCLDCKFYPDIKCASLPRIIRHEAHKHTLTLRQTEKNKCIACNDVVPRVAFVCDPCHLDLCIRCALLPRVVSHRFDEHPFTLTYSPIKDQPDEYYCEICEEEISSKYWFYHCVNCDQSLHTKCIHPIDQVSNIKFGVTVDIGNGHPHLLKFVRSPKGEDNSSCGKCGQHFVGGLFALECAPCNFWIHGGRCPEPPPRSTDDDSCSIL